MKSPKPNADVGKILNNCPAAIRTKVRALRELIFETTKITEGAGIIQETLKWGQPSYVADHGSTIRIGWSDNGEQYGIYFHCQSKLIATFREIYPDDFNFEGNRAILFNSKDVVAVEPLKHCIALALTYHRRKHLPLLGAFRGSK